MPVSLRPVDVFKRRLKNSNFGLIPGAFSKKKKKAKVTINILTPATVRRARSFVVVDRKI